MLELVRVHAPLNIATERRTIPGGMLHPPRPEYNETCYMF